MLIVSLLQGLYEHTEALDMLKNIIFFFDCDAEIEYESKWGKKYNNKEISSQIVFYQFQTRQKFCDKE